jgi:aryl-alcohol dehydrogenase-like predicted oxidoreductase
MWGGTDRLQSVRAIHAALDAGVNLIDTAPIYGFGLSEDIVGEAIRDRRDQVVLATKCGMVCDPSAGQLKFRSNVMGPAPNGHVTIHTCNRPESIRREIEASLQRLGTDHVDLYQTHWQDTTTPIEETMGVLLDLKGEGKIRAIGASNASVEQLDAYRRVGPLESDQERYSMLDLGLESGQLPYCHEHGIAVLAYSPLARGLLTGKVGPDRQFPRGDLRHGDERFSAENRRRVAEMLESLEPIAEQHNVSLAQLTIAWTFHQPGLSHVLCGARNPQQACENAAAADVELSDDELRTMREAIETYAAAVP